MRAELQGAAATAQPRQESVEALVQAELARIAVARHQVLRMVGHDAAGLRQRKQHARLVGDTMKSMQSCSHFMREKALSHARSKTVDKLVDTARRPILRCYLAGPGLRRAAMSDAALGPPRPDASAEQREWMDLPTMIARNLEPPPPDPSSPGRKSRAASSPTMLMRGPQAWRPAAFTASAPVIGDRPMRPSSAAVRPMPVHLDS